MSKWAAPLTNGSSTCNSFTNLQGPLSYYQRYVPEFSRVAQSLTWTVAPHARQVVCILFTPVVRALCSVQAVGKLDELVPGAGGALGGLLGGVLGGGGGGEGQPGSRGIGGTLFSLALELLGDQQVVQQVGGLERQKCVMMASGMRRVLQEQKHLNLNLLGQARGVEEQTASQLGFEQRHMVLKPQKHSVLTRQAQRRAVE